MAESDNDTRQTCVNHCWEAIVELFIVTIIFDVGWASLPCGVMHERLGTGPSPNSG
jgi:hypothetical protein